MYIELLLFSIMIYLYKKEKKITYLQHKKICRYNMYFYFCYILYNKNRARNNNILACLLVDGFWCRHSITLKMCAQNTKKKKMEKKNSKKNCKKMNYIYLYL